MKTKQRIVHFIIGLTLMSTTSLQAQKNNYEGTSGAIGLRAGETSGLTLKHFFANTNAIEGIISVWPYTLGVTGLYEFNKPTKAAGLNFYYGLGGHVNIGTARYRTYYLYRNREYVYIRRSNEFALGVDMIGGLEYKFNGVPLALSLDLKPYIEFSSYGYNYVSLDPGLGIKIVF